MKDLMAQEQAIKDKIGDLYGDLVDLHQQIIDHVKDDLCTDKSLDIEFDMGSAPSASVSIVPQLTLAGETTMFIAMSPMKGSDELIWHYLI
jgi:hypothetical protein